MENNQGVLIKQTFLITTLQNLQTAHIVLTADSIN